MREMFSPAQVRISQTLKNARNRTADSKRCLAKGYQYVSFHRSQSFLLIEKKDSSTKRSSSIIDVQKL